jgi:protein gp37
MNKQGPNGIEWCHFFGPGTGYTANPVRGCTHGCKWRMPDGSIVGCYAKPIGDKFYKGGFETVTWHPDVLDKIRGHKQPAGIFIDSMSDLFGQDVEKGWINLVIQTMRDCPQHCFFTLTKNPRRMLEFEFPDNVLVGVSAPPTEMYGKELSVLQQEIWYRKALRWLGETKARNKWTSIEPLSFDVSYLLKEHCSEFPIGRIRWAVIGAGSNGRKYYQPSAEHLTSALSALEWNPVFFKGNLDRDLVKSVGSEWKEEYPTL